MRFVILHYHILKNAGSTMEELLYWNFREKYTRFDTEDRDYAIPNAELVHFLDAHPHLQAVSSHQLYDPVPLIPGYVFFDLCFLRDPLERIRSTYDFFRGKPSPGDPVSDLASRMTLGEFIAELIENYPWMVHDVQTNQLANGLINDPPRGEDDLERASRRVLNTSLLGVVDRFAESVVTMQYQTRMHFPHFNRSHEPVNVSRGMSGTLEARTAKLREECGGAIFDELMRLNALDYELLRRAREEVGRRLKMVEDREERLNAFAQGRPPSPWRPARKFHAVPEHAGHASRRRFAILKLLTTRLRHRALFDAEYYARTNPDLPPGVNPRLHFQAEGAFEGRNPHPLIDLDYWTRAGEPHPLFDSAFYLRSNPDVRDARIDPLLHFVLHGSMELRKPHPWFDAQYYVAQLSEMLAPALANPVAHFLEHCAANPHPLFDCASYLDDHPGIDVNPLLHFLRTAQPPARASLEFEISDVTLPIHLARHAPEFAEIATFWQDHSGRTRCLSPSHSRPFLTPFRYSQLLAQSSGARPAVMPG